MNDMLTARLKRAVIRLGGTKLQGVDFHSISPVCWRLMYLEAET